DEMANEAEVIVTGRCVNLQSTWVENNLVTLATIQVSEVLKGQAGPQVTVVLPGGADSNRPVPVAMTYPAAPELQLQENAVLFLVPDGQVAQGFAIVGWSQGKYSLSPSDGKMMASQNLGDLNLQGRSGLRRGDSKAVPYEQLRQQIQKALAREKN
ncbi:MAG TPA: hypothetical protein VMW27_22965, partial [Thermoanaerobaculia bacterium]|nr:hypothetical protein [Thermoanaerobaculia bacterium]